ncbi:hypothetical protein IMSAG049_00446 [Clostridiales bacterium]|nr:hypothetical protein IMSAG049_00446 [Clostridiales bacterium]
MEDMQQDILTEEDLLEKQRKLEEKEEELKIKESKLKKAEDRISKAKYGLYDRIDVSVGTMDKIIAVLGILLLISLFAGIFLK